MSNTSRRLSQRRPLRQPVEAEMLLCGGDIVAGWIVDEQDDGLGMVFGAGDVERLLEHSSCCVGHSVDLWMTNGYAERRAIPVCMAHATTCDESRTCRAGLAFDVARMCAEDIAHLLSVWRHLMGAEPTLPDTSLSS